MGLPELGFEPSAPGSYGTLCNINPTSYIEQARAALETQRVGFESERAAFAEERKLWDCERRLMQQRIAQLERHGDKDHNAPMTGPTVTMPTQPEAEEKHHIWEGTSPTGLPSRIFPLDVSQAGPGSTDPDNSPSLDEALSPRSRPTDRHDPIGIPIEFVDSSLDGITLKSTALPPDIAAKVSSPMPTALPTSAPRLSLHEPVATEPIANLSLHPACLASPLPAIPSNIDDTPMDLPEQLAESSFPFPIVDSIPDESPCAPLPSLFPVASLDPGGDHQLENNDPALHEPLNLQNDEEHDAEFLEELDHKLLKEAKRMLAKPSLSSDGEDEIEGEPPEPEPELRFKYSTNFGSAFGSMQLES
ncbi:hypothetical protein LOZ53_004396 [Ophidiomyces ophidiicola]|nr:hypothetical protein LOZ61_005253 [Ophidiomyces ophidiicola]KAI1924301.1 hypothetical protein LOZ60_004762 [Ophidiomyces ophidiicola]KAI1954362.1 hypothetical protein LOZ59_004966 [Ophidiomyces ophidiicola]KAI1975543.1 hypothetical protein LOZ55_004644 [Ophidiomyces ophidiicola]KAI1984689.1 hypothetical protein LOZ51_006586 [Ophidiomyces ophidiicola]